MKTSVSFFAKVQDRQTLERVEFYAQDIQILRDLGFEVRIAITPAQIDHVIGNEWIRIEPCFGFESPELFAVHRINCVQLVI